MTTLAVVAAIISIVLSVASGGVSVYQLGLQHVNASVRQKVLSLSHDITRALESGRLKISKLLSLLNSRNQNALMTYLQNNPVISKKFSEIQTDSDLIAQIQAEQQALENTITNLTNELNQLGYSQSYKSSSAEEELYNQKKKDLNEAKDKYNQLADKYSDYQPSTVTNATTYTSDIDARSQNIKGGLVK